MTCRSSTTSAPRSRGGGARPARQGGTGTVSGTVAPGLTRSPGQSVAPVPVPPTQDRETDMAREWPVRDYLELGALPGAVPSARLHAHQVVWEWALTSLTESVDQVVSELVANSVAAARAMPQIHPLRLWLLSDRRKVLVLVWDANPQPPALIRGRRLRRKRPGAIPGRSVQRKLGIVPNTADGRQGCLGSNRDGICSRCNIARGPKRLEMSRNDGYGRQVHRASLGG